VTLMECAALSSYLVWQPQRAFPVLQVSRAPGSTILPSLFASRPGQMLCEFQFDYSVVAGLRLWESRKRFPSLAFHARRQLQTHPTAEPASSGGR
jgi:hypothetical protein